MTDTPDERWSLTLYINGSSPQSAEAVETVRRVCDTELGDRVELVVVDVHKQPALVVSDHIVATPTLVKRLPGRLVRLVGALSDPDRVRLGLDCTLVEKLEGADAPQ
jgi:circadian clock protein KaiB